MANVDSLDMTILVKFTDLAMCLFFKKNRGTWQDARMFYVLVRVANAFSNFLGRE
jgi:hypothetical protein